MAAHAWSTFKWKDDSFFKTNRSNLQEEVIRNFEKEKTKEYRDGPLKGQKRRGDGIVIAPCGSGKTAMGLEQAMGCRLVLVVCWSREAARQMKDVVLKHVMSSSTRSGDRPLNDTTVIPFFGTEEFRNASIPKKYSVCMVITTYSMLSGEEVNRSDSSLKLLASVRDTEWDLVMLDEVHHAGAPSYKEKIMALKRAKEGDRETGRRIGLTASLKRELPNEREAEISMAPETKRAEERRIQTCRHFEFVGKPVLVAGMERLRAEGIVANVEVTAFHVPLTGWFDIDSSKIVRGSGGRTLPRLERLAPGKLAAVKLIATVEASQGNLGMVFVTEYVTAECIQELLGDRWKVVAGGESAGGKACVEGEHSSASIGRTIAEFNNAKGGGEGKIDGLIVTNIGSEALDITNTRFTYAIGFDLDGSRIKAAQIIGRLSRTERVAMLPDESQEAYVSRCKASQKRATLYDLVSSGTSEAVQAKERMDEYKSLGYRCTTGSHKDLQEVLQGEKNKDIAAECRMQIQDDRSPAQLAHLINVLSYEFNGDAVQAGNAAAQSNKDKLTNKLKDLEEKKNKYAKNPLMKQRLAQEIKKTRKTKGVTIAGANQAKRTAMAKHDLHDSVLETLENINVSDEMLRQANHVREKWAENVKFQHVEPMEEEPVEGESMDEEE